MDEIERLIEEEELGSAQAELNKIGDKNARWHFLQGRIYLAKKWYSEARKQFKIAEKKPTPTNSPNTLRRLTIWRSFAKLPNTSSTKNSIWATASARSFAYLVATVAQCARSDW